MSGGVTVVAGFAESLGAPEAAWSLVDAGHRVVCFSRRGARAALRKSGSVRVVEVASPEEDAEGCVREVMELCAREGAAALMAWDDASVWVCEEARRAGVAAPIASACGELAVFALDKKLQLECADRAGLSAPRWVEVARREDLTEECVSRVGGYPAIVKARHAAQRDGAGLVRGAMRRLRSAEDLAAAREDGSLRYPVIVQRWVEGVGEGVFGFVTSAGETVALSGHRRVRMMHPRGSGSSACVSVGVDARTRERVGVMARGCGWRGLFMAELLRDGEGQLWFMEWNGRVWGSTALARRCGLEYPAWNVAQALDAGFVPRAVEARTGVVCRHLGREIVHALHMLRGAGGGGVARRVGGAARALSWRPGATWYNRRRGEWGVFAADVLGTVRGEARKAKRRRAAS